MAATWTEFWDEKTTIFVNERHSEAHYADIAANIVTQIDSPRATVLDFGCGTALSAARIASRCRHLWLIDDAASVRRDLKVRFGSNPRISIVAPARIALIGSGTVDLIIANSVAQYMTRSEFETALREWRRILAPDGKLVLADIVPPNAHTVRDAAALLRFAAKRGFLIGAAIGLIRTFFSRYRSLRSQLGLTTYAEKTVVEILRNHRFGAKRLQRNFGHNQGRMAFVATSA